jgi:DNA (cytosine-5)-methyltransferase 1
MYGMAVRRLTPVECERLQGFPDKYTEIPTTMVTHRKACQLFGTKEVVPHGTVRLQCGCKAKHKSADQCPDGPRYKALGNSWAVPVVRWIGRRVDDHLRALSGAETEPREAA